MKASPKRGREVIKQPKSSRSWYDYTYTSSLAFEDDSMLIFSSPMLLRLLLSSQFRFMTVEPPLKIKASVSRMKIGKLSRTCLDISVMESRPTYPMNPSSLLVIPFPSTDRTMSPSFPPTSNSSSFLPMKNPSTLDLPHHIQSSRRST